MHAHYTTHLLPQAPTTPQVTVTDAPKSATDAYPVTWHYGVARSDVHIEARPRPKILWRTLRQPRCRVVHVFYGSISIARSSVLMQWILSEPSLLHMKHAAHMHTLTMQSHTLALTTVVFSALPAGGRLRALRLGQQWRRPLLASGFTRGVSPPPLFLPPLPTLPSPSHTPLFSPLRVPHKSDPRHHTCGRTVSTGEERAKGLPKP